MVGHAGARLPADLADATGLTFAYSTALRPLRPRGTGHDPGRVATDLAVMLADTDEAALASLRAARATAREVSWTQATETGEGIPAAQADRRELPGLVLDLDATLVTCHSEKEQAAPTYKKPLSFRM
ncbi:hypothetical protein [Streptomyces sp. NBC_01216]|uniref:hypothetical protein n=1 Tax=Streptomyces sp. NBC_01216 TaxID=2903778 RepID=UPI003FA35C29